VFKPGVPGGYDGAALAAPALALSLACAVSPPMSERSPRLRAPAASPVPAGPWTPDLAADIGSPRWFGSLATLTALAAAALGFWPDFAPVAAAPAVRTEAAAIDELRVQRIAPLARGADSGRRTAPTAAVVPLAGVPESPTVRLTATLGPDDSFGRMLQRAGVGADEAARIAEMVASAVPLSELAAGTRFDLTLGRRAGPTRPRPVEALAFRARFELKLALERRGDALVLVREPIAVDATPLRLRGIVGASLYRSARAAGVPPKAIQQALRALDRHRLLGEEVRPSDAFDLVLGYKRAAGGEAQAGDLLYAGVERDGRPVAQLLRWGADGGFVDAADGATVRRTTLAAPVAGRVTSGFGMRRHPILGYARMHAGVDFKAPYGAPIYATGDGRVVFAGRHGGHGNFVRLAHGGGIGTGYGHMSRIAVAPGMAVRRGQVIGYVGSTGLSTGAHLHYELYRDGRAVNPGAVAFLVRSPVAGEELAALRDRIAALRALRVGAPQPGAAAR
jgi:murein DD-endopeptidase MepM/ murein hydrolase activator NlpD